MTMINKSMKLKVKWKDEGGGKPKKTIALGKEKGREKYGGGKEGKIRGRKGKE